MTIRDIRKETPDCVSIAFDIPEHLRSTFHFTQGQNITVRTTLDGAEVRRSYSICSAPGEGELRIAVKQVPQGLFSTHASTLKTGDRLEVLPPSGRFFTPLDPTQHKQYVAFAAGSGITPILSIIKTTLETEPHSQFTLVYGNKGRGSIIFKEALEGLKNLHIERFRVIHILSRERTDIPLFQGRIDAEKCALLASSLIRLDQTDEFFLCGPETMIFGVRAFLESRGIPEKKIHFELFTTPGQTLASAAPSTVASPGLQSHVTVKLDGLSFAFDLGYGGASILDAALSEGADLPFACKGGVCCTCRAKLVKGSVDMDANYALEPDELAAGYILTCQAHPRTPEVIVDFDTK
ncbi:1,2-phenylacetyl-CoA epoxidase subunit PaaE [Dinghuibacter silviterrae]|uniref:1,2-phenylacetyl-CoA epoxidase subunit PaaE n=1 Tax=Dinghuibacter silviterrae TaxID=1539049 RepID=UPI001FECE8C1|nr:1,2-phenylacetyl-CoA epoxidase subunit PaaE [Dinghuibacter silviterrae]